MKEIPAVSPHDFLQWVANFYYNPASMKSLRICVILIAIYEVLLAHVILLIMLLGLSHAQDMINLLSADIENQKEREAYYEIFRNGRGESLNEMRFKSASDLATYTLTILYICTSIAVVFVLCSLGLLIGILRNKTELMLPWLIFDFIAASIISVCMLFAAGPNTFDMIGGQMQYWIICGAISGFDAAVWLIVHSFYLNLKRLRKLTEQATVPIPCHAPGTNPYHYRKENMYIGDGAYKHSLTDNCNPNYVV